MARLIEELRKLPGIGAKRRASGSLSTSSARARKTLARWPTPVRELKARLAALLHLQQHHGCGPMHLLLERDP